MAALFAASYPERTRALVLFHASADGSTYRPTPAAQAFLAVSERVGHPGVCDRSRGACAVARCEPGRSALVRQFASGRSEPRGRIRAQPRFIETDLRDVLPAVRVPTLLLYRSLPERGTATMDVASRIPRRARCASPGRTTQRSSCRPRSPKRSNGSSPAKQPRPSPTACSRPSSSPTSSARPSTPPGSAIAPGASCWRATTRSSAASSPASAARSATRPATGSSRPSTARHARFVAAQAIVDGSPHARPRSAAGIHIGECELHDGKIAGLAVNIGARVAANAGASEVLVSQTVKDLVAGSGISFEDRGVHELKGIPGHWQLFAVAAADS